MIGSKKKEPSKLTEEQLAHTDEIMSGWLKGITIGEVTPRDNPPRAFVEVLHDGKPCQYLYRSEVANSSLSLKDLLFSVLQLFRWMKNDGVAVTDEIVPNDFGSMPKSVAECRRIIREIRTARESPETMEKLNKARHEAATDMLMETYQQLVNQMNYLNVVMILVI